MLLTIHDFAEAQTPDWKKYSSSAGEISVEYGVYVLKNNHDGIIVNIQGRSYHHSPNDSTFELWVIPPYTTQKVGSDKITPAVTDKGFFDYPLQLSHGPTQSERIPEGKYKVSIRDRGTQIGPLTFEVRYDYPSQIPKKPSISISTPPPLFVPPNLPKITIETDSLSYVTGDLVKISGVVNYFDPDTSQSGLTLIVMDPIGNRVGIAQMNPNYDGTFSHTYKIGGTSKHSGQYTVLANYEKEKFSATFDVNTLIITSPSPPPQIHKRAFIEVYGFGNVFDFSHSRFQHRHADVQFENNNGRTIHIYKDGKTIRDLFDSLNIGITAQCFTDMNSGRDFCSDSMHELKFSVNGQDIKILSNYVLKNRDLIKIEYERLATTPASANPVVPTFPPTPTSAPQTLQQPSLGIFGTNQTIDLIWIAVLFIITGVITAIIVAVKRINKKPKKPKPRQSRTKQVAPRGISTTSTMLFYECPQCHNPDISNNSDGTTTCTACGFKI